MAQWADSIVDAIVVRIAASLPYVAAQLDVERGVGANDATPVPLEYWHGDKWIPNTLPACEVICTGSGRVTTENTLGQWRHTITVVLTIAGTDEDVIARQMERLGFAMLSVLDGWSVSEGGITNGDLLKVTSVTYDLVQQGDEAGRPFIRSGLIELHTDQYL